MRQRILINLVPVSSGGGQKQALELLDYAKLFPNDFLILCADGTEIHKQVAREATLSYLVIRYSWLSYIFVFPFLLRRCVKNYNISVCYNFCPIVPFQRVPQVVRSVYSNLYYPEIDFWKQYSTPVKVLKTVKDLYRLKGTLKADGLIFENVDMLRRAGKIYGYNLENCCYVAPSYSAPVQNADEAGESRRVLYLANYYKNKNIDILPSVASLMKDELFECVFVLSLDVGDGRLKSLLKEIDDRKVEKYFEFIGTVEPNSIGNVISGCAVMVLLSDLECFSSSIAEAWSYRKPLVVTKAHWSSAICEGGAVYVDNHVPRSIFDGIKLALDDSNFAGMVVRVGANKLKGLNTKFEKAEAQVEFVKKFIV